MFGSDLQDLRRQPVPDAAAEAEHGGALPRPQRQQESPGRGRRAQHLPRLRHRQQGAPLPGQSRPPASKELLFQVSLSLLPPALCDVLVYGVFFTSAPVSHLGQSGVL